MAAPSDGHQIEPVGIIVPPDGGTPRDPRRIVRLGPREFRILAAAEEGHSPLTHAVSRADLIVWNSGPQAEVVLHLDLSEDGARTNYDAKPEGGMPTRDFLYIQTPGQPWHRMDGTTSGWVATFCFSVSPGETKFGLSPWYIYSDYLSFVESLPAHPHLQKTLLGKSDRGREHWELTVTDPDSPSQGKQRTFFHAREHAYETFSSFAIEGLVNYLLSPDAIDYRRHFEFTIHPMTNVDGVAEGYEYRTGYDFPKSQGTASARLTWEAMDRLRPDWVVTWHNWIAPRDTDEIFFTDSVEGRASRRAWDLFTQRFPSPRSVGHRWRSENDPNEKNWFGRALHDGNVHMYAMKHYGSRVWGWEMPWWGRDEGDPARNARRTGADFGRAFLDTLGEMETPPVSVPERAVVEVRCRETHEFELRGRSHVENPFRDATLVGEFHSPSGKTVSLEGFYCGQDVWKLRFVPEEEGEWRYLLRGEGVSLYAEGKLHAKPPRERGFIRIHPENPYAFAYADGSAFFPMGDTCYGLHDDSPITPELRRHYLDTRRKQRFNFVRMSVGHSEKRAAEDPATFWAWGGTPDDPDLDRLNPRFFDSLERVFHEMQARGMNAELLLLNFYRRPFTDPTQWTPARERLWLRHLVARFASFSNLFMCTLANEYETHPDGKYRLDQPGDVEWAKATARKVQDLDPYGHPVTVHPVISSSTRGASPRDPFEAPWRIGGFFGEGGAVTVLSQQTSSPYQSKWDETLQCWTGDAAGVEKSIAADRVFHKPVLNTENGYEYLPGYPTSRGQVYHTDTVRRASWRIVCAGGYFAAGFVSTLGHSDAWEKIDAPNRYPFRVGDSGAATQLGYLHRFFESLPFWRMAPIPELLRGDGLCFAVSGEVYVAYLPHGGTFSLDLRSSDQEFTSQWFNPRKGEFHREAVSVRQPEFHAPDEEDWVLLVKRKTSG